MRDDLDLTRRCEQCGNTIPDDALPFKKYCCRACYKASERDLERAARAEELAGRLCKQCNAPIPVSRKRDAVFCSRKCSGRATALRERYSKRVFFSAAPVVHGSTMENVRDDPDWLFLASARAEFAADALEVQPPARIVDKAGGLAGECRDFCRSNGIPLDFIVCGDLTALIRICREYHQSA